jgi:hypothetical protein
LAFGIFTDKNNQPTIAEFYTMLDNKLPIWEELTKFIRSEYPVQEDIKFMYGQKYGWALRFRIKSKLLVALYPLKNGFTVQIILNTGTIKQAQNIKLGKNVQQTIEHAKPYPEGRWLFIPVRSKKDVLDIQQLLELRVQVK